MNVLLFQSILLFSSSYCTLCTKLVSETKSVEPSFVLVFEHLILGGRKPWNVLYVQHALIIPGVDPVTVDSYKINLNILQCSWCSWCSGVA